MKKTMFMGLIVGTFAVIMIAPSIFQTTYAQSQPYVSVQQLPCQPSNPFETIKITYGGFGIGSFVRFVLDGVDIAGSFINSDLQSLSYGDNRWNPPSSHALTVYEDANFNRVQDSDEASASTSFTLTDCVLQPPTPPATEQIENLITIISNMNIDNGAKSSLAAPLNQAVNLLSDNDPNNDVAVCNRLNAFVSQVNAKMQNGQLTQEQSNQLLQAAQSIKGTLKCS